MKVEVNKIIRESVLDGGHSIPLAPAPDQINEAVKDKLK